MKSASYPYVIAKAAVSIDGYLGDSGPTRRVFSSAEDLAAVDSLRAEVDGILVGAGTLRADNPSLTVKDEALRAKRIAAGLPSQPARITLSRRSDLNPDLNFFRADEALRLVYCPVKKQKQIAAQLPSATVIGVEEGPRRLELMLADLAARGIRKLLVEGGATVHGWFFAAGAVDELRLAYGAQLVCDPAAQRLSAAEWLQGKLSLRKLECLGDTVVTWYTVIRDGR